MIEGVIFDIDGTLTATNELIFASFNHVAKKYLGKNLTDDEIIALFGPTEDAILKVWMKDNYEEARKDYYEFYSEMHHQMAEAYPGILEILRLVKSRNIPLSIYTGKGRLSSEITLEKIGAIDLFDMIVTGDDVENHKPSPEGIEVFVNQYKLNKDNVIMIGDAPADIIAAHAAGVKIASVVWDSYAKEKVLSMGSDFVFESVKDLRDFLNDNMINSN
jgi:HAD superfamily hydrolase (TIGR01509 family)